MKTFKRVTNPFFLGSTLIVLSLFNGISSNMSRVSAQTVQQGVVFDPPSNVRSSPNGPVLCKVTSAGTINIYGSSNGWYVTDACGRTGYIHSSQVRLQSSSSTVREPDFCRVINIQKGQLAVRFSPGGESRAGLNNGNTVQILAQQGIWSKVRVMQGPNSGVNGVQGWVNSNYLSCYDLK